MDAKSLLLRALVMRVARRAVFAAVMAWAAFGWISGRFDVVGGTQHMFAYLGGKLSKDRLAAGVEPVRFSQDAAAVKAASAAKAAGLIPASDKTAPDFVSAFAANDVLCLAHAVYFEAGREPREVQSAIAQVAMNRVRAAAGPKSICKVIYLGLGRPMGCLFRNTCRNLGVIPDDEAAWKNAMQVAQLATQRRPASDDAQEFAVATHFHPAAVRPVWARSVYRLTQKGKFVFYSSEPLEAVEASVAGVAAKPLTSQRWRSVAVGGVTTGMTTEGGGLPGRKKSIASTPGTAGEPKSRARSVNSEPRRSPFGDLF